MTSEWKDKVVVVTGASAGIGEALARELDARGATVVLAARSADRLAALAAQLHDAVPVTTDVTVREDVQQLLHQTLQLHGRVDVWVNNAGRGISVALQELTDEDVDAMVTANVKSVLYGMQAVLPVLREQGDGVLANVSSMLGRVPTAPFRSAYSAAKAAVNNLTDTARFELADAYPQVRVVLVMPGVVATDFGLNARGGGIDSRLLPGAQDVDEVARLMADGLLEGPLDLYTRPEGAATAVDHLRRFASTRAD